MLSALATVGILLYLDLKLALITFCVLPLLLAGSLWFRIISAGAFRRTMETIGAITAYLQESLSGGEILFSRHLVEEFMDEGVKDFRSCLSGRSLLDHRQDRAFRSRRPSSRSWRTSRPSRGCR